MRTDEAQFCGNTWCITVKLQQSQDTKFPQSTAALIVRCCLKQTSPLLDQLHVFVHAVHLILDKLRHFVTLGIPQRITHLVHKTGELGIGIYVMLSI